MGNSVLCTDNDAAKIRVLEDGRLPIFEPGLDGIVAKNRRNGHLSFSAEPAKAVAQGDVIFICVGTPPLPNGDVDLSSIDRVAQMIATEARSDKLVVEKSTVPAQTGQQLKRVLEIYGRGSGARFRVASNPEFLREGTAVSDFLHPRVWMFRFVGWPDVARTIKVVSALPRQKYCRRVERQKWKLLQSFGPVIWTDQSFLDVRVAVLDGTLEKPFRRLYPDFRPANDPYPVYAGSLNAPQFACSPALIARYG